MRDADRRRLVDALAFALDRARRSDPQGHARSPTRAICSRSRGSCSRPAATSRRPPRRCCTTRSRTARAWTRNGCAREFGAEIAAIVAACSDVLPGDTRERKSPWGDRKRRYLAQLASAPPRVQLVAACDKLHNLRTLVADLRERRPGHARAIHGEPRADALVLRIRARLAARRVARPRSAPSSTT